VKTRVVSDKMHNELRRQTSADDAVGLVDEMTAHVDQVSTDLSLASAANRNHLIMDITFRLSATHCLRWATEQRQQL